jgi:hypothetical protein
MVKCNILQSARFLAFVFRFDRQYRQVKKFLETYSLVLEFQRETKDES